MYLDKVTNYQSVLSAEFLMPCAFFPETTNVSLESNSASDVLTSIESAGCQTRINVDLDDLE